MSVLQHWIHDALEDLKKDLSQNQRYTKIVEILAVRNTILAEWNQVMQAVTKSWTNVKPSASCEIDIKLLGIAKNIQTLKIYKSNCCEPAFPKDVDGCTAADIATSRAAANTNNNKARLNKNQISQKVFNQDYTSLAWYVCWVTVRLRPDWPILAYFPNIYKRMSDTVYLSRILSSQNSTVQLETSTTNKAWKMKRKSVSKI